ncbi:hypothetical protein GMES_2320 [Paraglaciecola mesophila KMM 241]|uniref:Uncharacterized protein n=1 Tax=Paraglaciecola mesophila KMM 241 TaxID=1128912 RepID=K6YKS5_9ALTE|nr:hypothetical protein GMES_2320 [Paraglaciecola mesophila KMM 241]
MGEIPIFLANADEPNTNLSAPQLNTTNHNKNNNASTITKTHLFLYQYLIVAKSTAFAYSLCDK